MDVASVCCFSWLPNISFLPWGLFPDGNRMFSPTRHGPPHRSDDEYISFREVRDRFGFYGVKIGRWVTAQEQETAAVHFYDALCDLMHILQVPETVISLRETLALHYGTGGRPGVAAHYSPQERAFALAKNAGPGSIAHEWFHAFDHYIGQQTFSDLPAATFASAGWLAQQATPVAHPLNDLLFACFRSVMLDETGNSPSSQFLASAEADRRFGTLYYSQPEEMCARAFEAFVQDSTIRNNFLVKGTKQTKEARLGLYPQGEQRQNTSEAFRNYFACLGSAVERTLSAPKKQS